MLLYLVSKGLLIVTIISSSVFTLFFVYIYNNFNRKERLNIIKDKDTIYFHLSDDYLFSIKLSKEDKLSDILLNTVKNEMVTIKSMVNRIDFINFRDDRLQRKLNDLIEDERY
jgi:hypothetical protein